MSESSPNLLCTLKSFKNGPHCCSDTTNIDTKYPATTVSRHNQTPKCQIEVLFRGLKYWVRVTLVATKELKFTFFFQVSFQDMPLQRTYQ